MVKINPEYSYLKDITSVELEKKRIILRVDFNVPIENGIIQDETRINAVLKTIKYIISKKPKRLIIISHLGRPDGYDSNLTLMPVAESLSKKLNIKIPLVTLEELEIHNQNYKKGIFLLENIRFYKEEEKNDPEFSKRLANLGEIYINDSFATAHRKHSSTYGIITYLPSYVGFLIKKELKYLDFSNVKHPFIVIIGGSKVSTKLPVIKSLNNFADKIIIGSGMALTLYLSKGFNVGSSFVETTALKKAEKIFNMDKIVLPVDFLVSQKSNNEIKAVNKRIDDFNNDDIGSDIGKESIKKFKEVLSNAKTIFWNGPLGIYEIDQFAIGTIKIAKYISTLKDCIKIIGGGDISAAVNKANISNKFDFISTGGGASLELISKGKLPVLEAIVKSQRLNKIKN